MCVYRGWISAPSKNRRTGIFRLLSEISRYLRRFRRIFADFVDIAGGFLKKIGGDPSLAAYFSAIYRRKSLEGALDTAKLNTNCNDTYEEILCNFPWANITPSLHKLRTFNRVMSDLNDGFGLKLYLKMFGIGQYACTEIQG